MQGNRLDPLVLRAPAKINLFLQVTGKRKDGYHSIETAFQFLDFSDTLRFETTDDMAVTRIDDHPWSLPDTDLVLCAAELLRGAAGKSGLPGIRITLSKKIPPGSGMGGGSSNAATTLLGLNRLWNLGLDRGKLSTLGRELGADVPVFVHGRSCWATGVGDVFEPFDPSPGWFCVGLPEVEVSTKAVFFHPDLVRNSVSVTPADYNAGRCSNTLEPITRLLYPGVDKALDELSKLGRASMNGTGSSVFIRTESRKDAERLCSRLPGWLNGFVTRSLNDIRDY